MKNASPEHSSSWVCVCFDVLAVNIRHGGRVGEIQFIETFSKIHAMRVQHCPHRAIGDDRFL